jgi:hypothetical protein
MDASAFLCHDWHEWRRLRAVQLKQQGWYLMILTLGLPVALLLWQAARALRAPPGAGYS